jgi:fructan beta-fructosidase
MYRSNKNSKSIFLLLISICHCLIFSTKAEGTHVTPDPLFDQAEFNFHTYSASYDQTNRPQFHFTSREGGINDPNGLIYYDGEWHMYFQHKGQKNWGHAVSTDLIHWQQLEHAIVPHKGHCVSKGQIWSGTSIIDHNNTLGKQKGDIKTIVSFFTHTQKDFHQDGAYSTDKGRTFTLMGNLVPNQGSSTGERDPKVVFDPETKKWIMLLTAGVNAVFESSDLMSWKRIGKIEGIGGECPDLFQLPLDGDKSKMKWVITNAGGKYGVGNLKKGIWTLEEGESMQGFDAAKPRGNVGYAWQTFDNGPDGRVVQLGFMQNQHRKEPFGSHKGLPFTQQMSFPVELTLHTTPSGIRLFRNPIKEIEKLYIDTKTWNNITLDTANDKDHLGSLTPDLMDLSIEFTPGSHDKVSFNVRGIDVRYTQSDGKIRIKNNVGAIAESTLIAAKNKNGKVQFRVLFDRTSFEIFVNDGAAVATLNCAPKNSRIHIEGADDLVINKFTIHELSSIWKKRK